LPMAMSSLNSKEALRLPDLLVLVKQTAECARNHRVLDSRAAMVPDEVLEAKVLHARARAWLLGQPQRRAEPKWRGPGDVEAAFFALYDALRLQSRSALVVNAKNSTSASNLIGLIGPAFLYQV
jgi:hypothetical protein